MSWDEALVEDYDVRSARMTADIPFYVELARAASGPLVELAVGTGRVAIPVAQATGRRIIGFDSSPRMLAQARAPGRPPPASTWSCTWATCASSSSPNPRPSSTARTTPFFTCPPGPTDAASSNESRPASHPRGGSPGTPAFDHRIAAQVDGKRQHDPVGQTIHYGRSDNRIDLVRDDGATSRLWWATKNEWLGLLDVSGLELESLHGDFTGQPITDDSPRYVFVARRPT